MKLEWAMSIEDAEVANGTHAVLNVGHPFSATAIEGDFPEDGMPLELPVLLTFSTDPEPGLRDFTFSYRVLDSEGQNLGGRKARVMLAVETPTGGPSRWPHPYPLVHSVRFVVDRLGPYEIQFWINDDREEFVLLSHLLGVD